MAVQPTFPDAEASPHSRFSTGADVLSGTDSLTQPTRKERYVWGAGWRVTDYLICSWASRDTHAPALLSAHPVRAKSYLREVVPSQYRNTPLCLLRLEYIPDPDEFDGADAPNGSSSRCPADTISEDGTTVELAIQTHEDFEAQMSQYWNWQEGKFHDSPGNINRFTGVESYLAGSLQVTTTNYYDAEPADIEPDLATLADPPGKTSAAGLSQYLIVGGSKVDNGAGCWVRTVVYQFVKQGWDDIIYS